MPLNTWVLLNKPEGKREKIWTLACWLMHLDRVTWYLVMFAQLCEQVSYTALPKSIYFQCYFESWEIFSCLTRHKLLNTSKYQHEWPAWHQPWPSISSTYLYLCHETNPQTPWDPNLHMHIYISPLSFTNQLRIQDLSWELLIELPWCKRCFGLTPNWFGRAR